MQRDRTYLGEVTHRDASDPGLHEPIVDIMTFREVQTKLDANATRRRATRSKAAHSPLAGRIRDADGQTMSPIFAYGKAGQLYRYYVSAPLQRGGQRDPNDGTPRRVSVPVIENTLSKVLARLPPRACTQDVRAGGR
jgi:hypothetical protein